MTIGENVGQCNSHSGICEKIISVENQTKQLKTDMSDDMKILRDSIQSMNDKFDRFQNWVYGLLATSFVTIVISVITRFIK
jgi:hypothetical protein